MGSWFFPQRSTEASLDQLVASGSAGSYGYDPVDGDTGYRRMGEMGREVPSWTLEKSRILSVNAYRTNPMARAIIDTYTSFCVGDSGVSLQCTDPQVHQVATDFWDDARNRLGPLQTALLRHHLLMGESVDEMMVGEFSGTCRYSPIDPSRIRDVELDRGNPLWPLKLHITNGGFAGSDLRELTIAQVDDISGLRTGEAMYLASWKALITDVRGQPFLAPILDWLDSYDQVLFNLIDRTALMRYMGFDVTLKGPNIGQPEIDDYVKSRGGVHVPRSGTMEVHNEGVEISPLSVTVGAQEDTTTAQAILTGVAGGAGLSKPWISEGEGANRATSLTMAEPVRRRISGVQQEWLDYQTDKVRYAVDQAVRARRLPQFVATTDTVGDLERMVPAAAVVKITGPEIAATDAEVTASVMVNLSKSLTEMVVAKISSPEAARLAWQKAWEQFVGRPYTRDLDPPMDSSVDDLAQVIDQSDPAQVTLKLA